MLLLQVSFGNKTTLVQCCDDVDVLWFWIYFVTKFIKPGDTKCQSIVFFNVKRRFEFTPRGKNKGYSS